MAKVVLITGGSDGLGREMAKRLSRRYRVVVAARNEDELKKVAKELRCSYMVMDVCDREQVGLVIKRVKEEEGSIDVLINNAGRWIEGRIEDTSLEVAEQTVRTNLLGVINVTHEVIPLMKEGGGGVIINISSQAGLWPRPERSVYAASKFGVTGLTRSWQEELGSWGIRVVGIYPGKLKTRLFEKSGVNKDLTEALEPSEVARTVEFVLELKNDTLITEIGIKSVGDR